MSRNIFGTCIGGTSGPKRTPVIGSVWLVRRDFLKQHGGFSAVKNAIRPEQYFADIAHSNGKYRLLGAASHIGISTRKHVSSQIETAIRLMYPMHQKSIPTTMVGVLLAWLMVFTPLAQLLFGFMPSALQITAFVLAYGSYLLITAVSLPRLSIVYSPIHFVIVTAAYIWYSCV